MKDSEILQPLFDMFNLCMCELSIDLNVSMVNPGGSPVIYWYVGNINKLERGEDGRTVFPFGDMHDWLYLDDIDEDKLNRWVAELTAIYRQATWTEDSKTIYNCDESIAEIHDRENGVLEA